MRKLITTLCLSEAALGRLDVEGRGTCPLFSRGVVTGACATLVRDTLNTCRVFSTELAAANASTHWRPFLTPTADRRTFWVHQHRALVPAGDALRYTPLFRPPKKALATKMHSAFVAFTRSRPAEAQRRLSVGSWLEIRMPRFVNGLRGAARAARWVEGWYV